MRKTLLLVATLGTLAMLAAPAAAGDYRSHHPQVRPSFGLGVFVWPAPKTVHHHHPGSWHLRPQPVHRFAHPLPRPSWHQWHRPQLRHFDRRHHGDSQWRHGGQEWRHGHAQWRDDDRHRRHSDQQWRHRSGRDHGGHDRRHH